MQVQWDSGKTYLDISWVRFPSKEVASGFLSRDLGISAEHTVHNTHRCSGKNTNNTLYYGALVVVFDEVEFYEILF